MRARHLSILLAASLLGCGGGGSGSGGPGTGGVTGTGGTRAGETGGAGPATSDGGTIGTGGAVATGGITGSGGLTASGGRPGSGGLSSGGGTSSGGAATGGARATGGQRGGAPGASGGVGQGGIAGTAGGAGGGAVDCPGAAYDAAAPPQALTLSGSLGAHDPAALVAGTEIYLYATGLIAKTSANLTAWTGAANPLNPLPSWIGKSVPGATNLWAPDISTFGGAYHLYYAASTFGSNTSCIGHATRAALTSGSWTDQGSVVCSNVGHTGDDWNAIDPNVVLDDDGTPWLAFGSFWGGIKMVKLDATGARADDTLHAIAARPSNGGALEGAWVFKRCGSYYLFTSWGSCCSSPYDYNIRVGRASAVTGPYVDKAGTQLTKGGGTLVVTGNTAWVAPGHNAVIAYGGKTYNLYHALQGSSSGAATLRIAELVWDADGWPVSGGP